MEPLRSKRVGLATINSVTEPKRNTEANGLDVVLEIGKGKKNSDDR
ncbi:hypothetical protein WIW89_00420 [Stygiolobus sp. CP850M]